MPIQRTMPTRRALLQSATGVALLCATGARADDRNWPEHPVRVIVPYPAGGSTDVLARILAEHLKELLGQPFVIENRPGAGGNIGIATVTGSAPDGYTMGAATIGHFAINQFLYSRMPFDAERDMVPASLTWELPNVFVVAADYVPAKTVAEFVVWAKQKGRVTFGSPGVGTSPHLSGVLFAKRTGIEATHVPFRGAAQTIPAMLAGDVNFAIDNLASYIPSIESGKLRALAVTSAQRWPTMPNVPTMAEAGINDFVVTSWAAFVFPAATPRPIIDKVSAAMRKIAADDGLQKRFLTAGARCIASTPEEALAYAAKERAIWQDVVKLSGAKVD
ncbi:tripartite tricarboxylate transporter substrate binding protein [Microbacteriaceae bacterium K1510]|nr:tripartite tricarboxylate transporter substrate binding protein [Microbacteriaceae bacterium K1510]